VERKEDISRRHHLEKEEGERDLSIKRGWVTSGPNGPMTSRNHSTIPREEKEKEREKTVPPKNRGEGHRRETEPPKRRSQGEREKGYGVNRVGKTIRRGKSRNHKTTQPPKGGRYVRNQHGLSLIYDGVRGEGKKRTISTKKKVSSGGEKMKKTRRKLGCGKTSVK